MKSIIVCATTKLNPSKTLLGSLKDDSTNIEWILDNKKPLTNVYNEALQRHCKSYTHIFFIHDDVILRQRLSDISFNDFTVIGLAGTKQATIKSPFLWHLTANREHHLGAVAHTTTQGNYYITSFGEFNKQAVLIDGVFIGIDLVKWNQNPVYFDQNIPTAFHFYDLCFSLDCNLKKIKVGVVDFPITHASPGLSKGFEEWKKGEQYCLQKYSKFLNKTLTA